MLRLRHAREETGAAAVEFAILLIPFVVLCFGMISAAIMLNDKLALTQGVREGARYGATLPYDPANSYAFLDAIRTTARGDSYGLLDLDQAPKFCVGLRTFSGGTDYHIGDTDTSTQPGPCPGAPTLANGSLVVIGSKAAKIDLIVSKLGLTLSSTSVARYEGLS